MISRIFCLAYCLFAFGYTLYVAYYVIFHLCLGREDDLLEGRVAQSEAGRDLPLAAEEVAPGTLDLPLVLHTPTRS